MVRGVCFNMYPTPWRQTFQTSRWSEDLVTQLLPQENRVDKARYLYTAWMSIQHYMYLIQPPNITSFSKCQQITQCQCCHPNPLVGKTQSSYLCIPNTQRVSLNWQAAQPNWMKVWPSDTFRTYAHTGFPICSVQITNMVGSHSYRSSIERDDC